VLELKYDLWSTILLGLGGSISLSVLGQCTRTRIDVMEITNLIKGFLISIYVVDTPGQRTKASSLPVVSFV
jgi:hypothetical protein